MDPDSTHTLVDPDHQNALRALDWSGFTSPKSNSHGWRTNGSVLNRPGLHSYIKGKLVRILHFFWTFLSPFFSSSPFSLHLQTLTLKTSNLTRNGSFVAQRLRTVCLSMNLLSKSHLNGWINVNLQAMLRRFDPFGSVFFLTETFMKRWELVVILTRSWILKRFLWFRKFFLVRVRVWIEPFGSTTDSHWFGLSIDFLMMYGKVLVLPVS